MDHIWNNRRITKAQRKALEWLPADGSPRNKPGSMGPAVKSLELYHRNLAVSEGATGPRGGRYTVWRLTDEGQRARRYLIDGEAQ